MLKEATSTIKQKHAALQTIQIVPKLSNITGKKEPKKCKMNPKLHACIRYTVKLHYLELDRTVKFFLRYPSIWYFRGKILKN